MLRTLSTALVLLFFFGHAGWAVDVNSTAQTPSVNPPAQLNGVARLAQNRGTLLNDRFGVTLGLQAPFGGSSYNAFDFASFAPTKNTGTVEWVESDWYGTWNSGDFSHTNIRGQYPSGTEYYDVEGLYFDNDDVNLYIAVVTSTPHLKDWGSGNVGVGIYESRISPGVWIRPGDLSLNLGLNAPRVERNGTRWSYDYGVDITHDDRNQLPGLYAMRDNDLGASLYRTSNDVGGTDVENPVTSDWFTGGLNHNTTAYWEHTSIDPYSDISQNLGIQYIGETTVSYYEYTFPGGALENNAGTYIIEVTIPRALLGADNPSVGDTVGVRWVMGCRNDGNDTQAVIKLNGIVDGPTEDFGDAPDPTYPTLLASSGARHTIDGVTFLGAGVDADADGQPNAAALGDDNDGNDDEDGVTFTTALVPGASAGVTVTASVAGLLNAWIDFNGDGDWADAGEQIFTDQGLIPGPNGLTFPVPVGATSATTYARFRFDLAGGLGYDGPALTGEVEDYQVVIGDVDLDFGDAPDPSYPTLLANDGARHVLDGITYLGASVDAESDGHPDPAAAGDDTDGLDDENGIVFTTPIQGTTTATVQVTASVVGVLNAWIDYNGDGDWADTGEQVFTDRSLTAGLNTLTFVVPTAVTPGQSFARFRFSTAGGLSFTGLAGNGEVEDYVVQIEQAYDFGDAVDPTFPTLLANDGARHVVDGVLYLGTRVDADPDGQPNTAATGDDNDGLDDEDGVTFGTITPGSNVTITVRASVAGLLNGWMDWNRDGDWADAGEQIFTDQTLIAGVNTLSCFVPQYASAGLAYTRYRFSSAGGLTYTGPASNGEVEDYRVTIATAPTFTDWGDAPDPTYPTLTGSNGARHTIVWTTYLGTTIDGESNGQPNATATGDDIGGPAADDEDGVTFTSAIVQGTSAGVSVVASVAGILNAWMDFNRDGDWADAGEQIFTNQALSAGANALTFAVPAGASAGTTFSRFRFSTAGGLTYTGLAVNGEVEDYQVTIEQASDWGDAPDPTYPTLLANDGARHVLDGVTYLGVGVDAESDGQPDATATGDDLAGDDEDGVTFTSPLVPGLNASLTVVASVAGVLNAWIDFNGDGDWGDAGEQVFTNQALVAGSNGLTIAVPGTAVPGITYARFRFATAGGLTYTGSASNGEVEDYQVTIDEALDFGDAPDPTFPTLLAIDGARHVLDGVTYLGAGVDAETNGQPTAAADGDDLAGDDEDGVTFVTALMPGVTAGINVVASVAGVLNAWIDFNGDGDWADAGEQIFADQALVAGSNALTFGVPAYAPLGTTYARFRFSTVSGLTYTGLASDGEIEDYQVTIEDPLDLGDAPDPSYPTLLANDGARHITGSAVFLGAGVDAELDGQPNAGATGDDLAGDDEDGVTFTSPLVPGLNASVTIVASVPGILNAWIDFNGDGDWADAGEQIFTDQALAAGPNPLSFPVPAGTLPGITYARFRFSTVGGLTYTGAAPDGEVEDYAVTMDQGMDFGDAPDPTYPTLLATDGARHVVDGTTYLGAGVDAEADGQPTAAADGDDLVGDDEDGVTFTSPLVPGLNASMTIVASVPGILNAWMDFDGDGDWADAGEQIFTDEALALGLNNLSITVPATAVPGITYARFRFATVGGLTYIGVAYDGEVEDYQVTIDEALDFGDAPDPTFPTLLANDGARHVLDGVTYLGAGVDTDADGQPDANALGDDVGPVDDEDGVTFTSLLIPGNNATVTVSGSVAGILNAWLDFNGDGDWDDPGEQIFADQALNPGPNALQFWVPVGSSTGTRIGRFRFSTVGGLGYTGLAPDGEVEDHAVSVDVPIELGSFSATISGTSVVLAWVTYSESENLGYRIYRSDGAGSPYAVINEELIPGAGTTLENHEYSFVDETAAPGVTYSYRLADVSTGGLEVLHAPITVSVPAIPTVTTLNVPAPHPIAGSATLGFALPAVGHVRLALYDMAGRERRLLVDELKQAGWHSVELATGGNGTRLTAGAYVLRLQTISGSESRRVVITD